MALSKNDAQILESIVDLDGKCMLSSRCKVCPFRVLCLPEFINPNPPSTEQRKQLALDVLMHHSMITDENEEININDHRWDKK